MITISNEAAAVARAIGDKIGLDGHGLTEIGKAVQAAMDAAVDRAVFRAVREARRDRFPRPHRQKG